MSKDIKNVVNKNIEIINKSVHKDLNNTNINYNSKFDTSAGRPSDDPVGVDVPKLSPPRRSVAVALAWTCAPVITLRGDHEHTKLADHARTYF